MSEVETGVQQIRESDLDANRPTEEDHPDEEEKCRTQEWPKAQAPVLVEPMQSPIPGINWYPSLLNRNELGLGFGLCESSERESVDVHDQQRPDGRGEGVGLKLKPHVVEFLVFIAPLGPDLVPDSMSNARPERVPVWFVFAFLCLLLHLFGEHLGHDIADRTMVNRAISARGGNGWKGSKLEPSLCSSRGDPEHSGVFVEVWQV
mmetsp:Transcript_51835/g.121718  ORF Transcript_51835/g.121718 Transcript_51835/m.121718 type:complete len:205 (-) Transcript_51835:133-747(-)|eukprot:3865006-Rhodomonas_salina.2